jgi:hypothetical protein
VAGNFFELAYVCYTQQVATEFLSVLWRYGVTG